jgi:hypothetical protein
MQTVTQLYASFQRAHAAYRAVVDHEGAGQREYDVALNKAARLALKIAGTPANSIAEALLKIRVALWDVGSRYQDLADLDTWRPGTDVLSSSECEHHALVSLRDDLARLAAGKLAA